MEEQELDPYEKQLLVEFESCDEAREGSLDLSGLQQLCDKLQLDDHGQELMAYIVGCQFTEPNKRITFQEFRAGLLAFLEESQNVMKTTKEISGRGSPDREVSPKFVFGKKKYGRRSRPESAEFDEQDDDGEDSDLELVVSIDGEHQEVFMRPRQERNEARLQQDEIVNLGGDSANNCDLPRQPGQAWSCGVAGDGGEAEGLRAACARLGVGHDGFLDDKELARVCQAVGMESLAGEIVRELFEKLNVDSRGRISLEECLVLLRGGGAPSPAHRGLQRSQELSRAPEPGGTLGDPAEKDSQCADLSAMSVRAVEELWEAASVPGARRLLRDLGYHGAAQSGAVSVPELGAALEEELRQPGGPREALLQAALCLCRAEARGLRSRVEQVTAERDKLRADIVEANERAALLAQEVDDHHARLQEAARLQVRLLEQRHAQATKELAEQMGAEREQLAAQNARLERQLSLLQEEDARLRAELAASRSVRPSLSLSVLLLLENEGLERENQSLQEQLSDARLQAQKHAASLQGMQHWASELERRQQQEQVLPLLEQVQQLQAENMQLRDQCDELSSKCETLAARASRSVGVQAGGDWDPAEESSGGGTKRRGRSPGEPRASAVAGDGEGATPRVGKIRRCCNGDSAVDVLSVPGTAGLAREAVVGAGTDAGLTAGDTSQSSAQGDASEVARLHLRISCLEQELERVSGSPAASAEQEPRSGPAAGETGETAPATQLVKGQLKQVLGVVRDEEETEGEVDTAARCRALERSLELLRLEYERCEDYWAGKLEEERRLSEQEQAAGDDKLAELLARIREYEETWGPRDGRSEDSGEDRLSTVEERASLERQVTELEEECEELRQRAEHERARRGEEMARLSLQLQQLEQRAASAAGGAGRDVAVQVAGLESCGWESQRSLVVELDSGKPCLPAAEDAEDLSDGRGSGSSREEDARRLRELRARLAEDCHALLRRKDALEHRLMLLEHGAFPPRAPKAATARGQAFQADRAVLQALDARLRKQEQQCRQLQSSLKKQQQHSHALLTSVRRQHEEEVSELRAVLHSAQDQLQHGTQQLVSTAVWRAAVRESERQVFPREWRPRWPGEFSGSPGIDISMSRMPFSRRIHKLHYLKTAQLTNF
ncbi:ninein-like protein isoform X2 [Bacillus rossius redtenbacheri]|uniref:ninein-like protein isoform X2 n=1 Tax=Bacillus rossius redtenbacheri TaxID=93214 RepID=UPI002FDDCF2B